MRVFGVKDAKKTDHTLIYSIVGYSCRKCSHVVVHGAVSTINAKLEISVEITKSSIISVDLKNSVKFSKIQ